MNRTRLACLAAVVGVLAVVVGAVGLARPALSATTCADYPVYSVLGSAVGVKSVVSAPGASLVDRVDANLPGAQAESDSLHGSNGWAGAPYSDTVAGNVGLTGVSANQLPVFAVSSYPSHPDASNSTPIGSVQTKSTELGSTAQASAAGPGTDQFSLGRLSVSAAASCGDNATLQAVSDTDAGVVNVAGVLRLGAIRSHAKATTDPSGHTKFEVSTAIEGATVMGQSVAISDKGLVVGPQATALPDNPLLKALETAGISVHYVAAVQNQKSGEATAPGLQVVVTRDLQGVGTGPASVTFTFGEAYARATTTGAEGEQAPPAATGGDQSAPAVLGSDQSAAPSGVSSPLASSSSGATPRASTSTRRPSTRRVAGDVRLPLTRIANWSITPLYVMGAGTLLLVFATWVGLERLGVRFRWR